MPELEYVFDGFEPDGRIFQARFRHLCEKHHDECRREKEHAHYKDGRNIQHFRAFHFAAYEQARHERREHAAYEVERTADQHELVPLVSAAAERVQHGVDDDVEETRRESGKERAHDIRRERGGKS